MSNEATLHSQQEVMHGAHDHHDHEHHHEDSFISKYVFSMDHKMIAKQFLITGIIWAVIGAFFSVLFRLQLGFPDATFPWLESILGHWAKGGRISAEAYYALVTMHGTILVFFVLTAGLSGTFSNLLIPLQVGARDMASPFMNCLSYWFFFLASLVMMASLFVQTGPASGGWTMYPPLSALGDASIGSKIGVDLWLTSMALFVVSQLLGGLNYISTILNMRTKGMAMTKMPLTIWAFFFTAVLGVLSFPVLLSGFILLLMDRHAGTSFYLSDIFIAGKALANEGGSAILYQHLFWFLGHPEVYIIVLPAMGMVSEVLAVNSRKPIFGYLAMIGSLFAICILAFLVWAHHMFVTGLNPFLGAFFVLLTLLIAVPSAIKVFNWITTIWRGKIHFTPASLFSIGFVSTFISGGLTGIWLGNSSIDIHLHDTYFVIAHFHIVMGVSAFFGMFAGIYHWFPKMYGRFMNNTLGYIHFWITLIGAYLIFWPMHYEGMAGMPRRYYDYSNWASFNQFEPLNHFISVVVIVVFATQLLFIFNFFYSIFKGRKMTTQNPWKATSLEWTTPINPGHGNWPGEIPEVHRWAYDYSKDGRDFIPQTEPIGPNESAH
ncbi:cytochrome c oxidase subunit 1 [Chitinophaga terrae (ex Kim and Jung 2007)]|uniref:Cytochrome c oxidase subunit 1 n=1 Tax=Chitinophaga terrae (ex Kim and Jung 2007) TaxID=408074 RepID=A0A1H4DV60_9BACT|nr:cbb3-type cytochrome c oxidase subunit I [Chitinophaga terrae (ex Kim and Jung 2007)]MDQ0105007.1 cytochrome c oxidase subunit 1 [Chitinophaga terrae (ex Kim and Jung 2007)]GEP91335.1 cytochrome-c oxidase [Chitinophaga terrae (ex Kim and Jung 2007)]SEA76631.1 cytochrome c oxidase subunit 1 [Chitinophaga terrae (ex Kim and Jung 2007)]